MFYISGDLIGLISKIIQAKKYKILFQKYTDEFINCIGNKKNDFTSKVDKNNLYLVEHAIQSICSYQCFELPNFICSIFFSTVLLFFISFIHYQYFIFCIISILVVLAETIIKMKYTDSLCKKTIDNCLTNSGVINQTVQYIYSAANNFLQLDKIKKHFKSNYHEYSNIYIKNNIFSNWTDFILSFFEKIIFIAIVIAYVYASKGSSASNLIFICGIFGMF
jgi:ABC-type bacteriocin/lantibiotic exporter with double-glycine peptidase domain